MDSSDGVAIELSQLLSEDLDNLSINEAVETPISLDDIINENPDSFVIPLYGDCLLYTSPSPRDATLSRMPSSA